MCLNIDFFFRLSRCVNLNYCASCYVNRHVTHPSHQFFGVHHEPSYQSDQYHSSGRTYFRYLTISDYFFPLWNDICSHELKQQLEAVLLLSSHAARDIQRKSFEFIYNGGIHLLMKVIQHTKFEYVQTIALQTLNVTLTSICHLESNHRLYFVKEGKIAL